MTLESITDEIKIQRWMWKLIIWFLGILGTGAVATIVLTVNWVFFLHTDIGEIKAQVAATKTREQDFNNSLNSIKAQIELGVSSLRTDVQQLQRTVDVMKAREGTKL